MIYMGEFAAIYAIYMHTVKQWQILTLKYVIFYTVRKALADFADDAIAKLASIWSKVSSYWEKWSKRHIELSIGVFISIF